MSFEDLIASLGETGDLGEDYYGRSSGSELGHGRFRPRPGDLGETVAQLHPAFTEAEAAPMEAIRPIRPLRPGEADEIVRLVKLCGNAYRFTEAEHHAALAAALADPDAALTCYRTIAAGLGLHRGTRSAD